jgi:5,10-methylenetetrahydromethanopterin reductase
MAKEKLVAYYLATSRTYSFRVMKSCWQGQAMSWPATEEDYIRTSKVIPDDVVRNLMAVGTTEECRAKVKEYIDAGVTCPILYPMMDDIKPVIDAFADWG